MMKNPSVINSPSGRVPKKASRWDLSGTEGYDGGKSVSWTPPRVSGWSHYIARELGQTELGGPQDTTAPTLEARRGDL